MTKSVSTVVLAFVVAVPAAAETVGAVHSQSAHSSHTLEEAKEDEHKPRHGGYFGDADDVYHYEVLLEAPNRLVLYVNDEHNQPLDTRSLKGRWTLNPDEPAPVSGDFAPAEGGAYLVATLPPLDDPHPKDVGAGVHVEVAVQKDGVWAEMEFFLPRQSSQPPQ